MGTLVPAVPQWLEDLINRYAGPQAGNPEFVAVVAAGAKAESGWDPSRIQPGGGGRGLFQFDLGGMGAGIPLAQLFDPNYQASKIVPIYEQQYERFKAIGASGADLAANVAGSTERPKGYNPLTGLLQVGSAAWNNYATAWAQITASGQPSNTSPAPTTTSGNTGAAASTTGAPGPGGGTQNLDFSGSVQHVLVQVLLVFVGIALLLGGIYLIGRESK